jgi:hypothetical protein
MFARRTFSCCTPPWKWMKVMQASTHEVTTLINAREASGFRGGIR